MRPLLTGAAALLALSLLPAAATAAEPPAPVRLSVHLADGARLGGRAAIRVGMTVDVRRLRSPATDVRILTPRGLDVATSRLGTATCRRPQWEVDRVIVPSTRLATCPRNALLGSGTAQAALIFGDEPRPVTGTGRIQLFSGGPQDDQPGLTILADTVNPVSMQLSYVGQLLTVAPPFGLALRLQVRQIPRPLFGAQVALAGMRVSIGSNDIVYSRIKHGRTVYYHPGGVVLPDRCPRGGLRFRAALTFADGTERTADASVACPPRRPRS